MSENLKVPILLIKPHNSETYIQKFIKSKGSLFNNAPTYSLTESTAATSLSALSLKFN